MDPRHEANAASFGQAAAAYERGRPPYPPSAVDWLLPASSSRILDLGAGTGKLTRQLTARGLDVTAVEPSDGMRAVLQAVLPGVPALAGSAEAIPQPAHSFDCVLVAQAWHWVDPQLAIPEVTRVCGPAGGLGLLWNLRDTRVDWVAELGHILASGSESTMTSAAGNFGKAFTPTTQFEVSWQHEMTPSDLLDMVTSRSYVITASADHRHALLARVRGLLEAHPALAGRPVFQLPYITQCFRADLLA